MIVLGLGLAIQSGCGTEARKPGVAVSGRVIYEGKPLANGIIMLSPPRDVSGRGGMGRITDGRYSIDREEGPEPGEFEVSIIGIDVVRPGSKDEVIVAPKLPEKYNARTTLRIQIPRRNAMEYSFDLEGPEPGEVDGSGQPMIKQSAHTPGGAADVIPTPPSPTR
jgi:hypothetical protein